MQDKSIGRWRHVDLPSRNFTAHITQIKNAAFSHGFENLAKYPELRKRMQSLLQNGEKITPKQWKVEIQSLRFEYDSIGFYKRFSFQKLLSDV